MVFGLHCWHLGSGNSVGGSICRAKWDEHFRGPVGDGKVENKWEPKFCWRINSKLRQTNLGGGLFQFFF